MQRPVHSADLDPHEVEDGVHEDGAVRWCAVHVHLVVAVDAGLGVARRRLPHAVGHALAQNLNPQNKAGAHQSQNVGESFAGHRMKKKKKWKAYRAQLVGLHHEHPDELLDGDDVVLPQLPVERAFLADLLEPPDVVVEVGRVVLAVELAAVVPDVEGLRHGLLDPGAVVGSRRHANADPELAAAHPGRVVRELELAHRGAPVAHGEGDLAGEERALALALLHDALLELLGRPVLAAVRGEVADERDQLDAERRRERRRGGAGVRVHEDDLQRVAGFVLDLAAREDREVRRGPERQLPRRALGGRGRRRRSLDVARALHQHRLELLLHLNGSHETEQSENKSCDLDHRGNGGWGIGGAVAHHAAEEGLDAPEQVLHMLLHHRLPDHPGIQRGGVSQARTEWSFLAAEQRSRGQLGRVRREGREAAHPLVVRLVAVVPVLVVEPLRRHCCYPPRDRRSPSRAQEGLEAMLFRER